MEDETHKLTGFPGGKASELLAEPLRQ